MGIGNTVNNYGARWVLELLEGILYKVYDFNHYVVYLKPIKNNTESKF